MNTRSQIFCGAAMRTEDPPEELQGLLYGPGSHFGAIHDSTYIRVLAFGCGESRLLMVCFENPRSLMPEKNVAELSQRTGIPVNNILYFCTHNHAGVEIRSQEHMRMPFGGTTPEEKAAHFKYEELLHDRMLEAVDEALANMKPARLGWGTGESYINANRLQTYHVVEDGEEKTFCGYGANMSGPVDRTLFVMRVEDMEGKAIAFFLNYAIHDLMMFRNNYGNGLSAMSGDLSGGVCQILERQNPGSVAMWSSGAAGDVQPAYMRSLFSTNPDTGAPESIGIDDYEAQCALYKAVVYRHFDDIKKVLQGVECKVGKAAGIFTDEEIVEAPPLSDEPFKVRLHLVRLGDLALMGISGEPFTKLGFAIKNAAPVKDVVLVTHDGHSIQNGYTQDDESLLRILESAPRKGRRGLPPPRFKPGYIEDELIRGTRALFERSAY